jgi:hypothetical protein
VPAQKAEQADRAEIYARIGLQMIYRPGTETVLAEIRSTGVDRVHMWCPRPNTANAHTVIAYSELALP